MSQARFFTPVVFHYREQSPVENHAVRKLIKQECLVNHFNNNLDRFVIEIVFKMKYMYLSLSLSFSLALMKKNDINFFIRSHWKNRADLYNVVLRDW